MNDITEAPPASASTSVAPAPAPASASGFPSRSARAAWWVNGYEYVMTSLWFVIIILITIMLLGLGAMAGMTEFLYAAATGVVMVGGVWLFWNARKQSHLQLSHCIDAKTC
jgi:hypothetical protein